MNLIKFLMPALAILAVSCSKDPGKGGKATIKGKIIQEEWNSNTGQFTGISFYAPDVRVYVDYSVDGYLNDDIRTNYAGEFEFRWLRKGDYEIVVYSECLACDPGVEEIRIPVSIDENKELVEMSDITIKNW